MRVNKKYLFIIASVLLTFLLFIHPAAHALKDSTVKTKKHFLWSVESERSTVYLLGSIHILKSSSYPLPSKIDNIYECCRKMVFETDIDGVNDPAFQQEMIKRGMYPAGQTLSGNITSRTYEDLKKKLAEAGLHVSQFKQFRPWLVAQQLAALKLLEMGFEPDLGIDSYFFKRAKKDAKETVFLETNEYQLNLFAGLGKRQQERLLKQIIIDLEVVEKNFPAMVHSWMTGDVDRLDSLLKKSFEEYPELYKRFITSRNRRWVPKIERLLRQNQDVLIIIGVGHLIGKGSVVELLKKKGYKVSQL